MSFISLSSLACCLSSQAAYERRVHFLPHSPGRQSPLSTRRFIYFFAPVSLLLQKRGDCIDLIIRKGVFGTMERRVRSRLMASIHRQNPLHGCFADPERPVDTCAGRTLGLKLQTTLPMLCGDGFASFIPGLLALPSLSLPVAAPASFPVRTGATSPNTVSTSW